MHRLKKLGALRSWLLLLALLLLETHMIQTNSLRHKLKSLEIRRYNSFYYTVYQMIYSLISPFLLGSCACPFLFAYTRNRIHSIYHIVVVEKSKVMCKYYINWVEQHSQYSFRFIFLSSLLMHEAHCTSISHIFGKNLLNYYLSQKFKLN